MAHISFTDIKIWTEIPTITEFVTELCKRCNKPRYMVLVNYAFSIQYFALINRKLYLLVYSKQHNGWVIGFMHTSEVRRNYIPIVMEAI